MSIARESKNYRLRTDVLDRLRAMAKEDNRTENNFLETLVMWALKQPGLREGMKNANKTVTLGEIIGGMHDTAKTLRSVNGYEEEPAGERNKEQQRP